MVYSKNFVIVVKCGGKILRERDGIVTLPFGSEYSLLVKNLDSRKCSCKISVDDTDIVGGSLIIDGNSESELEGFITGTVAKNKFKFIQKTKQIQDHRGDNIDDGMIRVEFAFEKPNPISITWTGASSYTYYNHHYLSNDNTGTIRGVNSLYSSTGDVPVGHVGSSCCDSVVTASCSSAPISAIPDVDEGITVKGSEINQQFRYGSIGELEASEVIVLILKGETTRGTIVKTPITVKTKLTCSSCGRVSKSNAKFCINCGTFLE